MSTPSKRRRTNGYKSSPQTLGSLDFFFGKQNAESESKTRGKDASKNSGDFEPQTHDETGLKVDNQTLTDEELARKLQSEWDQQDNSLSNKPSKKLKDTLPDGSHLSQEGHSKETHHGLLSHGDPSSSLAQDVDSQLFHSEHQASVGLEKKATLSLQSAASAGDAISSTLPFDMNPLTFDPGKYIPALQKRWATEGGNASYGLLIRCFVLVNSTQSRIKIVDTLVNFLRTIIEGDPESLLPAVSDSKLSQPHRAPAKA